MPELDGQFRPIWIVMIAGMVVAGVGFYLRVETIIGFGLAIFIAAWAWSRYTDPLD